MNWNIQAHSFTVLVFIISINYTNISVKSWPLLLWIPISDNKDKPHQILRCPSSTHISPDNYWGWPEDRAPRKLSRVLAHHWNHHGETEVTKFVFDNLTYRSFFGVPFFALLFELGGGGVTWSLPWDGGAQKLHGDRPNSRAMPQGLDQRSFFRSSMFGPDLGGGHSAVFVKFLCAPIPQKTFVRNTTTTIMLRKSTK